MLDRDHQHPREVGRCPLLKKLIRRIGPACVRSWRLPEAAQLSSEVPMVDHQRIARRRMLGEPLRQENDGAEVHRPAPELGEQGALHAHVLHVLRVLRLRQGRDLLVERQVDRRVAAQIDMHFDRLVVKIARRPVPLLAFALIHVELDDVPVAAMEGRVFVEDRLHPVFAGRNIADALQRIAEGAGVDVSFLACA